LGHSQFSQLARAAGTSNMEHANWRAGAPATPADAQAILLQQLERQRSGQKAEVRGSRCDHLPPRSRCSSVDPGAEPHFSFIPFVAGHVACRAGGGVPRSPRWSKWLSFVGS
jgi:hypothetical protein